MKKRLQLFAVAVLMMAFHGNALAYDGTLTAPSGQTLYYDYVDSTGSITLVHPATYYWTGFTQPVGALVLPDSVLHGGTLYPVTAIGGSAFENCDGLTSVTIPQGVTSIGSFALSDCGLVSLTIPDGVASIGYHAFNGIRHIDYHGIATWASYDPYWGASSMNGVVMGDFVFSDSTMTTLSGYIGSATDVTIPATVDTIASGAFSGFNTLSNIVFPAGLVSIGNEAFLDCYYLTSLNFPDSLRTIGARAFADCLNVHNVRIPDSVTSIGGDAFFLIRHLEYYGSATYADDNLYWGAFSLNGVQDGDFLFSDSSHTTLTCYLGNGPHVTIPATVDTIGQGAFIACEGLSSVTIPDDVSLIGTYAFAYCINLHAISLPSALTTIGDVAFHDCEALTSLVIPDGVTSIGTGAFGYCTSLTSINLPDGLTTIEGATFMECHALPAITIPASVTEIGAMAFVYCSSLRDVYALRDSTPVLVGFAFWRIHDSAVVHIPCGSLDSYTDVWSRYFDNFSEDLMHRLEVLSSDETMGGVELLTEPDCEQEAVVLAVPASGFLFEGWSITPGYQNLVTDNPLTIGVSEDMTVVAHFVADSTVEIGSVDDSSPVVIRVVDGGLVVDGAEGETLQLFDLAGRQLANCKILNPNFVFPNSKMPTGVYLVKVGSRPAQKVVVMK